jgi:hypothetical protein
VSCGSRIGRLVCVAVSLVLMGGLAVAAPAATADPPRVELLAPAAGLVTAAPSLPVRASVVRGHHLLERAELSVDGGRVATVSAAHCRDGLLVDAPVDLSGLAEGEHRLEVTALTHRDIGSATTTFTVERSLPVAARNLVEQAATPTPFACLEPVSERQPAGEIKLNLVLGAGSDGLDPANERLLLALGDRLTVLEPGALERRGSRRYFLRDRSQPLFWEVELRARDDHRWELRLRHEGTLPAQTLLVRAGDDWGGIDLHSGERAGLAPELDTSRRAQATIGPAGGSVETTDADGVRIHLRVPAGALTRDTEIAIAPLTESPVPGGGSVHAGVKLAPEGLAFAEPATLTFDFAGTGTSLDADHFALLVTSPLTAVPLAGVREGQELSAQVHHFSTVQPGPAVPGTVDLGTWANAALAGGTLNPTELQALATLTQLQQQIGCSSGCIDGAALAAAATEALNALVAAECQWDIASPSEAAVQRWVALMSLAQELGADDGQIRTCLRTVLTALVDVVADRGEAEPWEPAHLQKLLSLFATGQQLGLGAVWEQLTRGRILGVLQARIDFEGTSALAGPTDDALERLLDLAATAQQLGFDTAEQAAYERLAAALRGLLAQGEAACAGDATSGRAALERALNWVMSIAPEVAGVDASLEHDIQSALDDCGQSGGMTVQLWRGFNGANSACGWPWGSEASRNGFFSLFHCTDLGGSGFADPPLSLSATTSAGGFRPITAQLNVTATGGRATIAAGTSGTGPCAEIQSCGGLNAKATFKSNLRLRFDRAGTLTIRSHGDWGSTFTGAGEFAQLNTNVGVGKRWNASSTDTADGVATREVNPGAILDVAIFLEAGASWTSWSRSTGDVLTIDFSPS